MWIKVHYTGNQNHCFWNLQILKQLIKKNIILKDFGKVKIIRTPAGFDLVT